MKKKNKKSFLDSNFLNPISKLIIKISELSAKIGSKLEQSLLKKNTILFVTLFISIVVFIMVDQKMILFTGSSAEVLKNQPVSIVYNEEAYVVEGIPETVDITLIGRKADLYFAKQSPSHDIVIDLSDLKPGTHKVPLKYNQALASIDYQVNPGELTIVIKNKVSQTKTLTKDVLNQDKLSSKLVIKDVKIDNEQVIIKGSKERLEEVAIVKALIDINKIGKQEVGTSTIKDVDLKAYDKDGNFVDVEIIPGKVNAEIEIESPSRELPIKVVPKGEVAFGYAISDMKISETNITVYGDASAIENLKYIPVEVDVSGLKTEKEYKLEISKPSGIKSMSINNITVNITADKSIDLEVNEVKIISENLKDGLAVQGISASDISISVVLKGVESVVNSIKAEDIEAYLDLKNYDVGEHEVEVKVRGEDLRVKYIPKTKKVKIIIKKK